jgi:hypothetical protein
LAGIHIRAEYPTKQIGRDIVTDSDVPSQASTEKPHGLINAFLDVAFNARVTLVTLVALGSTLYVLMWPTSSMNWLVFVSTIATPVGLSTCLVGAVMSVVRKKNLRFLPIWLMMGIVNFALVLMLSEGRTALF